MKNMIAVLFVMLIICIYSVYGMDNLSDNLNSSDTGTEDIDLTENIEQKLKGNGPYDDNKMIAHDQKILSSEDKDTKEKSGKKDLSQKSEDKFDENNKSKRKHRSKKTLACKFCQKIGNKCCEGSEDYNEELTERKKYEWHTNDINACEFCQKTINEYKISKVSGKALCTACYVYEIKYSYLIPPFERGKKHNDNILECEFCQNVRKIYIKSSISNNFLCRSCYRYERKHGHLIPQGKRRNYLIKHKDKILVCEYCQRESTQYTTGKISGKSLCCACYKYERIHGHLIPPGERGNCRSKHKHKILVCESCQTESTQYTTGKISSKALCKPCYWQEYVEYRKYQTEHLLSTDGQEKYENQLNNRTHHPNPLIDAEKVSNESQDNIDERNTNTTHITENQIESTDTNNIVEKNV